VLIINTYAASDEENAMNGLEIPNDQVSDKIIVSIHIYEPYDFALNVNSPINTWNRNDLADTSPVTAPIDRAYDVFVSKGIPVIIGEFGAMNKNNVNIRAEWAEFYVNYAKSKSIPCFWWDNGIVNGDDEERFGLLDRKKNKFVFPSIVEALMRGIR